MLELRLVGEQLGRSRRHVEVEGNALLVGERLDDYLRVLQRLGHVERAAGQLQLSGFHLGEVEDVVDQLQQVAAAVEDVVGVLELPVVQVAKGLVAENLGKADDGVERGA